MCFSTQLEDSCVIILSSQTIADENEEIGQQVMALTDQDGFIPGQIYYRNMPERRDEHGEFITGGVKGRTLVIASFCRHGPPQRRLGTWHAPSGVTHTCLIPSQP